MNGIWRVGGADMRYDEAFWRWHRRDIAIKGHDVRVKAGHCLGFIIIDCRPMKSIFLADPHRLTLLLHLPPLLPLSESKIL